MICHYCHRELPEPGMSHIIFADTGKKDAEIVPVCVACRKLYKAKLIELKKA